MGNMFQDAWARKPQLRTFAPAIPPVVEVKIEPIAQPVVQTAVSQ